MRKQRVTLENVADASLVERYLLSTMPVVLEKDAPIKTDKTSIRACQSGYATERHTFARSRWAKEHQYLSIHLEGDAQRKIV